MRDWHLVYVASGRNVPAEVADWLDDGWTISEVIPGHDGYIVRMYKEL